MNRADRWLALLLRLKTGGWHRAADLAAALGVSVRTIYRDADALEAAGASLAGRPGTGYRLAEQPLAPGLPLTTADALVVLLASNSVPDADALAERLRAARDRLRATQPDAPATPAPSRFHLPAAAPDDEAAEDAVRTTLRRAVRERRTVCLETSAASFAFDPYGLVHRGAAQVAVGFDHERGCVRHVRLRDVQHADGTDRRFEPPAGYRTPPSSGDAAGCTVRVLFAPSVARQAEATAAAYVTGTEAHPEGTVLTLAVPHAREALPWLLSWGTRARVLAPASLRQQLQQEARRAAAGHETEPSLSLLP